MRATALVFTAEMSFPVPETVCDPYKSSRANGELIAADRKPLYECTTAHLRIVHNA